MQVCLLVLFIITTAIARADETWSGTISKSPGTYTGIVTVASGANVTLQAGTYNFDTLIVTGNLIADSIVGGNTGVIVINATTMTITGSLRSDGTGNAPGAGTGYGNAGGTYGGHGGWGTTLNSVKMGYGSATNPLDLGSGGATYFGNTGGTGGGAISLAVSGTLTVSGALSSIGTAGMSNAGGGSGGSIKAIVGTLAGAGSISVAGGNGSGGGGGGRAYIAYSTANSFTGTYNAAGGTLVGTGSAGTPGSFFVVDSTNNDLYIPVNSSVPATNFTYRNITIPTGITLNVNTMGEGAGAGTGGANNQNGGSYGGYGGRIAGASAVTHGNALAPVSLGSGGSSYFSNIGGVGGGAVNLTATGTFQIDGSITANGGSGSASGAGGGSGGSIYLQTSVFAGAGSLSALGGNTTGAGAGGGGRISVAYSTSNTFSGTLNVTGGSSTRNGGLGSALLINSSTNSLFVIGNSSLPSGDYTFANVTINSGASLLLDGMGTTSGGTGAGTSAGGGSYGGKGGGTTGGATFGTAVEPTDLGAPGASNFNGLGGYGGGALKLTLSGTLTVNGTLASNGNAGWGSGDGGGSGGSLWIITNTLAGNGVISANGGNGNSGGGGGGGRIYVRYTTNSFSGTSTVNGGTQGTPLAQVGTMLFVSNSGALACNSAITVPLNASEMPSPAGALSITNGCTLTITGDYNPTSITVTGVSSSVASTLILKGNVTVSGDLNVTNYGVVSFTTEPTLYTGYTFSAANIALDANSKMTADGAGYTQNSGPGYGSSRTGAGHGGYGGRSSDANATGPTYGRPLDPITVGSGGGNYLGTTGGTGGGAIRVVATGSFAINGTITAKGNNGASANDGGGSGGSISLFAGSFSGAGVITAAGGSSVGTTAGGGGGGGRIYLKYSSANTYSGTYSAAGGTGFSISGGLGTIIVVNGSTNDLFVPVSTSIDSGTYSFNNVTVATGATLSLDALGYRDNLGPGTGAMQGGGGHGGLGGRAAGANGVTYGTAVNPVEMGSGGGRYFSSYAGWGGGALKLTVTGTLTVNGNISTNGSAGSTTNDGAGAGGSLWLDVGTIVGAGSLTANGANSGAGAGGAGGGGGGRIYVRYATNSYTGSATATAGTGGTPAATMGTVLFAGSSGGVECITPITISLSSSEIGMYGGNLVVSNGCKMTINGDIYPGTVTVTGSGSQLNQNGHLLVTGNIDVTSAGVIVMGGNTIMNTGYTVSAGSINIAASSSINATGKGHVVGTAGSGAPVNSSNYGAGGGNGGRGADSVGAPIATGGAAYGNVLQATTWGFAGSNGSSGVGGVGGGAITFIVPGTFTVNGTLAVNGMAGTTTRGGGGAGGSLWLTVGTITGSGTITANGGAGAAASAGGGGGGYIYVFYNTANTYTTANATATRGANGNTGAGISTNGVVLFTTSGATGTKLVFIGQPTSRVRKNAVLPAQPILVSQDASNNIVSSFTGPVTLAAYTDASCTTAAGGSLSQTMNAVNGAILFEDVSYSSSGVIYIRASSAGLTSACSAQVLVGGERATQLVFTTQPSSTATAGQDFAIQQVITAQDANGITDIFANLSGVNPYSDAACTVPFSGGTLNGVGFNTDGVTTFVGADFTKVGTLYLKTAQTLDGNAISGCSNAIVVSPAAPAVLAFTDAPTGSVQAGLTFSPNPVVEVQDAFGNLTPSYAGTVTIGDFTNTGCTAAASGNLTGEGSFSPSSGVLTVTGLSYDTVITNLRICAKASGLTSGYFTINVTAGPAAMLAFQVQPANTGVAGVNLRNAQAVVRATDQYGNQVGFNNTPTVKVYTDAACLSEAAQTPVFSGGLTGSGSTRVYTFTSLRYGQAGTYYVGASYSGLTTACSSSVALSQNAPLFFRIY
ncbi:beta strand repeat-containing protein [Bdellovibrio sp. HCB290]|uniref:beta strand repeat-containing protein n=1 Tax=Bdellovibrio sp. HCB290 TaxID=3394356 RepID=UPI0039B5BE5C